MIKILTNFCAAALVMTVLFSAVSIARASIPVPVSAGCTDLNCNNTPAPCAPGGCDEDGTIPNIECKCVTNVYAPTKCICNAFAKAP